MDFFYIFNIQKHLFTSDHFLKELFNKKIFKKSTCKYASLEEILLFSYFHFVKTH